MIWIITLLGVLCIFIFVFYLIIFLKFRRFINEDRDRIRLFSNCCLENLQEVSAESSCDRKDTLNNNEQNVIENGQEDIISVDDF